MNMGINSVKNFPIIVETLKSYVKVSCVLTSQSDQSKGPDLSDLIEIMVIESAQCKLFCLMNQRRIVHLYPLGYADNRPTSKGYT